MKQNDLKERMARGESIYGMFLNSGNSVLTEVIGLAGFDFVLIDSEHGPTDVLKNRELVQAAEYRDVVPIIRVPNSNSDTILKALDIGAHGILVPRVNTAEDAQHNCASCPATTPWGCGGCQHACFRLRFYTFGAVFWPGKPEEPRGSTV